MSKNSFISALAVLLTVAFVVPATFFIAPPRASAQVSGAVNCLEGLIAGYGSAAANIVDFARGVPVVSTLYPQILAQVTTSAGATTGSCLYDAIMVPLARMLARFVLQQITASTINWINGNNGTGQPSFVLNLSLHLQRLGDSVALPFISQLRVGLNSPFGSSISASVLKKYAQGTSVGGFFAANQSTLAQVSPNPAAFIGGNFTQGGIPAFLALTTQDNNNPYIVEQAANSQRDNVVNQAATNRRQDLAQSGGFLSWCGTTGSADQTQAAANAAYQQCQDQNGVNADCLSAYTGAGGAMSFATGVSPGDSCTNSDGTQGKIQTPGSVIQDYTKKALVDTGMDQLVNTQDITSALGAIVTALFKSVLGGTGLFGASQPTGARSSAITSQLTNNATSNLNTTTSANSTAQAASTRASEYSAAWSTISAAANGALSTANSLKSACPSKAAAAQTAVNEANQVLTQAQTAQSTAAATQAFSTKVQQEAASNASTLAADIQALSTRPPTADDVTYAKAQATANTPTTASASASDPLTVSGGTLVDQMNLISQNAQTLSASCPVTTP